MIVVVIEALKLQPRINLQSALYTEKLFLKNELHHACLTTIAAILRRTRSNQKFPIFTVGLSVYALCQFEASAALRRLRPYSLHTFDRVPRSGLAICQLHNLQTLLNLLSKLQTPNSRHRNFPVVSISQVARPRCHCLSIPWK